MTASSVSGSSCAESSVMGAISPMGEVVASGSDSAIVGVHDGYFLTKLGSTIRSRAASMNARSMPTMSWLMRDSPCFLLKSRVAGATPMVSTTMLISGSFSTAEKSPVTSFS